ncbi:MAG: hypothetical protein GXO15_04125, partial [Crenarchaeota archaeon]|nr:hypothetical protein [Thermoproteota archaeon]
EDGGHLAVYRFDLDDLAGAPILEPRAGEEAAGLREPSAAARLNAGRGLLLDSLPWSGAWGSVSGLGLGPLIGRGGVEARLVGAYSASDTFLVPPRSLRVEVWIVIRPRSPGLFRATLLFDGTPVVSASSDGRTLVMGVIVLPRGSRYLAERFHRVALRLEPVRGTPTVVYHAHAWSLSETEPRGPGVYQFYSEAAGAPVPHGPTPRGALPIPRWGTLTLHLPLPSNAFLGSGSLELEVRGKGLPRLVKVYVAGLEVCSGPSYPGPGGLQVFYCRVPAYLLEYTLWGYMVVGRALLVKVELSGGLVEPYTWWVHKLRLEVTSRARLYVKSWAKSQVPYMVSSYPSEKMWSMAFNSPGSVTVYSYSLGHRAGATIAGAAGLVAGERPLAGMEGQDKHVYIYIPVGGTVAPYYEPGLAQAYVHGVDLWITLEYTGQREGLGTVRVLEARRLGRGGLSEEATRALGVASWMTGAASILLEAINPLAAGMAGVASLLLGYPSTFQQGAEAWHHEYYVYKTIMLHGEPVNVVLEMRSHVRAAAWLGPGGTGGGVYVDIGLAPYTLLWGRDSWRVRVEGTVTLIVSHPGSQQAYMLRLPLRGEAVFTWR